ncbi:MAG: type II toxin-antitoxin system HicA family toxin [Clostridiales bacterium]|nr:type II toxin-antitoxin system HicA family toxin [Clostridiales bacterium]
MFKWYLRIVSKQIRQKPNGITKKRTTIPRHPGDMPEGTLKAILNQAGVEIEEFLKV